MTVDVPYALVLVEEMRIFKCSILYDGGASVLYISPVCALWYNPHHWSQDYRIERLQTQFHLLSEWVLTHQLTEKWFSSQDRQ